MPNHVHGIIIIDNPNCKDVANNIDGRDVAHNRECRGVACNVSTHDRYNLSKAMSEISLKPGSLSTIIRSYKSAVTRWCRQNSYDSFAWQSRFYEHIIRNDGSLNKIRKYIINKLQKWEEDENYQIK